MCYPVSRHWRSEGSSGFTDSLSSYHGLLSKRSSNVCMECVHHSKGVEGLFGRLKFELSAARLGLSWTKKSYKHFLAEFLWRQRCSAFNKKTSKGNFVDEITAWKETRMCKKNHFLRTVCTIKFQMSIRKDSKSPWEKSALHIPDQKKQKNSFSEPAPPDPSLDRWFFKIPSFDQVIGFDRGNPGVFGHIWNV